MSSYEEHRRIDWSHPNEENGFYDKGTHGSAWWVSERKRPAVDVVVSQLESAYPYLELPKRNPLSEDLSVDQWREVRRRYRERHREVAERLLEEAYKYGKFLEGKDLASMRNCKTLDLRFRALLRGGASEMELALV